MSYRYSYKDFGDFFNDNFIIFPDNCGIMQTDSIQISNDIHIHRNHFSVFNDTCIEYDFTLKGITINVALEANFVYNSQLTKFANHQVSNNTIITAVNREKGEARYYKKQNLRNIIIFISSNFLTTLINEHKELENIVLYLEKNEHSKMIKSSAINIKTRIATNEIFNSKYDTQLEKIFIQSKVFEIIYNELKSLNNYENELLEDNIIYSEYDIKALHMAKNILISNIQNPPSIIELSKVVKLNEFKLKKGFRKLFGTTPYDFLLEHKLCKAKELLSIGEMNVSEVAFELGYKQIHGFSNAFLKRFGVRPKDLKFLI